MRTIHFYVLSSICTILTKKLIRKYIAFYCFNEKEGNVKVKTNNSNEKNNNKKKNDYCNHKDIESSSNNLANYDASYKNDTEKINSKNSEFCSDNDIANKADTNKVVDENPGKIHQKSEESKSREVSYSSEDFSSLLGDISRKNFCRKKWLVQIIRKS